MNRIVWLLAFCFSALFTRAAAAGDYPPEAGPLFEELQTLMEQSANADFTEQQKQHDVFAATIGELAEVLGRRPAIETPEMRELTVQDKLARIALHRRNNPQLYDELERIYIFGVHNPRSRFPRSPHLQDKHAQEQYRLAWEYYLLAPPAEWVSGLYDFRIGSALAQIGNPLSILTLREAFRLSSLRRKGPTKIEERQALILRSLNQFVSVEALNAMLEGIRLSREQFSRIKPGEKEWKIEEYVFRLISDQENYNNGTQWRAVLDVYAPDSVAPEQAAMLRHALQTLRNAGK